MKTTGLSTDKIILGLAAYGHSFTFKNTTNRGKKLGMPTKVNGFSGKYTKLNGFLAYFEICEIIGQDSGWINEFDELAAVRVLLFRFIYKLTFNFNSLLRYLIHIIIKITVGSHLKTRKA